MIDDDESRIISFIGRRFPAVKFNRGISPISADDGTIPAAAAIIAVPVRIYFEPKLRNY